MDTDNVAAESGRGAPVQGSAGVAALGAAGSVVLNLAPEIGRWLFTTGPASAITAVQLAVGTVTGSSDPDRQVEALADPAKAAALRMALAKIAAEQAEAATVERQTALLGGLSTVVAPRPAPTQSLASISYGAPLVSMIVLLTFGMVVAMALTRTMPQGAEPVLNVLLGTLGAMATSVVGYWVGSSAGSARKEERLANLAERN